MMSNFFFQNFKYFFSYSRFTSYHKIPIDKHEIKTSFMRSSGPGGQSVNKTNSKAQVRLIMKECKIIDQQIQSNIRQKYANYINKQNQLVVRSEIHKSQTSNLQECMKKIKKIIYECSLVHEQRKWIIPVESEENMQKRLFSKKKKSQIKSRRQQTKNYRNF